MAAPDTLLDSFRSRLAGFSLSGRGDQALTLFIDMPGASRKILRLPAGEYLCANDPQADIALLGQGDGAGLRFAVIDGAREIEVAALGDGPSLDGTPLPAGEPRRARTPAELRVGDATLRFTAPSPILRQIPRNVSIAALVALAAAALAMVLPSRIDPPFGAGAPSGPADAVAMRWTTASDAAANARHVLARHDLAQRVQATQDGRTLKLSGDVGGSEVRRWQEALAIIRARTEVAVENAVRLDPNESTAGRSIAAVAFSPERYVVTRDGRRVRVGEALPDGWTIREIDESRVLLERDGFAESVSF